MCRGRTLLRRCLLPFACLALACQVGALQPNGIASKNPVQSQYLADLDAITASLAVPSPPRVPDTSSGDDDYGLLNYEQSVLGQQVVVSVLRELANQTFRALDGASALSAR